MTNKFYWLKLKRDFFKRHDIRIIENMPNGKDYVLFYLKLLCESIDHNGRLRFSDAVPYDANMLSIITDTNIDTVSRAIKLFTELGMMDIMDDGTFYMNEVESMIGSAANNDNANRQRAFRERKKALALEDGEKKEIEKKPKPDYTKEFEALWQIYPRKQGKQNAKKSYEKARNAGTAYETVYRGIEAYKGYIQRNNVEERYVKQGSTWFNQNCWNDDYSTSSGGTTAKSGITHGYDLDALVRRRVAAHA